MIRIALTDDHAIFRESMSLLINTQIDMKVCIEAENGNDLITQLSHTEVDMVLLDLQMPGMDGLETCQYLNENYPDIKILILSHLSGIQNIMKVMALGANGYFTKNTRTAELFTAIRKVESRGFYFEDALTEVIKSILEKRNLYSFEFKDTEISSRELEIIKLYALEYTGKQIADLLNISLRTVESHKKNLMQKTNSKNFIGVITYTLINNLISLNELNSFS